MLVLGMSLAMLFGLCIFVAVVPRTAQFEEPVYNRNEPRI